jgi:hypothetical protein
MTTTPDVEPTQFTTKSTTKDTNIYDTDVHPLANIFTLGYVESEPLEIFKSDKVELIAKFRTLTPSEFREIMEESNRYDSAAAQLITERTETLARCVVSINHMPLLLTNADQEGFHKKYGRMPSPLDMARIILNEKINSMVVLDALYEKYMEFNDSVIEKLENLKKN